MTKKSRRKFGAEFKAKVVLEALKERATVEELARKYELQPTQINTWKKEAVANLASVFTGGKEDGSADLENKPRSCMPRSGSSKWRMTFKKKIYRKADFRASLHG